MRPTRFPLGLAALALALAAVGGVALAQAEKYRVGDRLPAAAAKKDAGYREITWDSLIPKGWDPMASLRELKIETLQDGDPRAQRALEQLQELWKNAPVDASVNNKRVRIPGFVVPLDGDRDEISEFLLVPYFGACIHVPPPPSNQVIHVTTKAPLKKTRTMDAVWVQGNITTGKVETGMGSAGYKLAADSVAPYKP